MSITLHKANTRGHANHGWLDTYHTFSFAGYFDPARTHFGSLRVLNDDTVAAGMGFGTHPHDNMEIVTIPLKGVLEHKDSMGNHGVIKAGDVQVMSAGTGIQHSEFNHSKTEEVRFLQIWIFSNKRNVEPRYEQMSLDINERKNKLQQLISPDANGGGLWIHQDAWFHLTQLDEGKEITYGLKKKGNGIYVFVIEGTVDANGTELGRRDGAGFTETDSLVLKAKNAAEILVMEVPMKA